MINKETAMLLNESNENLAQISRCIENKENLETIMMRLNFRINGEIVPEVFSVSQRAAYKILDENRNFHENRMKELSLAALKELELKLCKCGSRNVIPVKLEPIDETRVKIKYACFCMNCNYIGPARVSWEGAIKAWNNSEKKIAKGECSCGNKAQIFRHKPRGRKGQTHYQVYCDNCEKATGFHTTRSGAMREWNENITPNNNQDIT